MRLKTVLVTVLAASQLALPAFAQVHTDDHRRQPEVVPVRPGRPQVEVSVEGFAPQSGRLGTVVTIRGTGFTPKTKIKFGGRPVRLMRVTPNEIDFSVPAKAGNASIILDAPGVTPINIGTFQIIADPVIRSFAPAGGVPGTRVEVRGDGFRPGDQVLIGQVPMAVSEVNDNRLVATVPDGAVSDFIVVARPNGPLARSRTRFQVAQPNPQVAGIQPTGGPPGTVVRITGDFFGPDVQVLYGRQPAAIRSRSVRALDVVVPNNARRSELFTVQTRWGLARTAQPFELEMAPSIDHFAPTFGGPGTRVVLSGDFFRPGDQVTLNGRRLHERVVSANEIEVEISPDAQTGPFVVERGGFRTTSRTVFEVAVPPMISGFNPPSGQPGTQVTISGAGFSPDARVLYGRFPLRQIQRISDSQLVVVVPRRANSNQQFTVSTRGGDATSAQAFQIITFATVTGFDPPRGPVGTRVTIRGQDFGPTDRFFLGGVELPIAERNPAYTIVTIPQGARTERLSWESYGQRFPARMVFTVLEPPVIVAFSPNAGPPGTQVAIDGDNFSNGAAVFFGQLQLQVIRRGARQLVVVIPANAAGADYLWVDDSGARVRSASQFQVVSPLSVTGVTPDTGPAGAEITVTGANFTRQTDVLFDGQPVAIVRRQLPGVLIIQVPPTAAPGRHQIAVSDNGVMVRSPNPFVVMGWAAITDFAPLSGRPGTRVTIRGRDFKPGTRIMYGNLECQVVRVDGRGTSITAIIPPDATGRGYLWAIDGEHKERTGEQFQITP